MACRKDLFQTDFKTLQKHWYKKLKEVGFEDIEDTNSPREYLKTWHSTYFIHRYTKETFEAKAEYYRMACHFLYEYDFENNLDRIIWELHSDGKSFRDISIHLKKNKIHANKDKINKIVTKLVEIMKTYQTSDEEGPYSA